MGATHHDRFDAVTSGEIGLCTSSGDDLNASTAWMMHVIELM